MMKVEDGGPAFPCPTDRQDIQPWTGMSLRDYFMAHAPSPPAAWLVNEAHLHPAIAEAEWRRQYADALLSSRAKEQ